MKFLALLILMSFSFQSVDAPPPAAVRAPKTCCARVICLCKHAKGAPCDYKARRAKPPIEQGAAHDGDCPFHKGMKKSQMQELISNPDLAHRVDALAQTKTGISQAPCHTNTPKLLVPQPGRDYEPPISFEFQQTLPYQVWFQSPSISYLAPGLSGPDHPPRAFLA